MFLIFGLFVLFFSMGLYFLLADFLKIPSLKTTKVYINVNKRAKRRVKNMDIYIVELAGKLSKYIRLSEYKKKKLLVILKSAEIKLSPETYVAMACVKAGIILIGIIPVILLIPIGSPIILIIATTVYFKESRSAEEKLRKKREEIEYELPRFVATIKQELKASRDVLSMLETYKKNTEGSFKRELEITTADMKSGSYEGALTRFEARMGSSQLSDAIRGLISVLRGDNGLVYFTMLSHDMKMLEIQRLKTVAMKRPGKIRKYSFMMLACLILMYMTVMAIQMITVMKDIF